MTMYNDTGDFLITRVALVCVQRKDFMHTIYMYKVNLIPSSSPSSSLHSSYFVVFFAPDEVGFLPFDNHKLYCILCIRLFLWAFNNCHIIFNAIYSEPFLCLIYLLSVF